MDSRAGWPFLLSLLAALTCAGAIAAPALGAFGVNGFDASLITQGSEGGIDLTSTGVYPAGAQAYTQAGGHPYEAGSVTAFNTHPNPANPAVQVPDSPIKSAFVHLPAGVVANQTAVGECSIAQLTTPAENHGPSCPIASQIGFTRITFGGVFSIPASLYNLEADGVPTRWGAVIGGFVLIYDAKLRSDGDYGGDINVRDINQVAPITLNQVVIWGTPADPSHDGDRCNGFSKVSHPMCAGEVGTLAGPHPAGIPAVPYVTLPTRCTAPGEGLEFSADVASWEAPEAFEHVSVTTHEGPGYPDPVSSWGQAQGVTGCDVVPFNPGVSVTPSTENTEAPSGLSVEVTVPSDGILNTAGISQSSIRKAVITLPEGVTANPSAAEGLSTCSPAQLKTETLTSEPGDGCPDQSKVGTLEVESPLLEGKLLKGTLFMAAPDDPTTTTPGAENPFDSLLALYIVVKEPQLGVIVKLAAEVEPDPKTGRLVTTVDNIPQLPFSHFRLQFREGARSLLVSPAACGDYQTKAEFTPWSNPDSTVIRTSPFKVTHGIDGGPCPPRGVPPFHPSFEAGSINNNAKSYTPFYMRLIRRDGEQDMTKFSAVLPPGVLGKLAGVAKCPEAAIALAGTRTGRQELASPSCPSSSQIGHVLAGAGVGSVLTYVDGKVYLGGPYKGDPLSVVVIVPGVVGPFDAGTVVTREALTLNPETAEVEVDGANSDPIPHILKGIVLKIRDIRVHVDRPSFILNPTSCDPSSVDSTLFGSYLDVLSPADDVPVGLSARFQAANCANLGFKPRLSLKLSGGTRRGGHPALRAVLHARDGDANIRKATVTLPSSAFLDQAHIRTICTRVQFAAKACPQGSIYGYARAWTPLLDDPIEGPVYLRSSNHKLPDLVAALQGLVDVNVVGRIDSYKGGIRSSFETVPDAPVSKFVLSMQGGRKGLVVNSRSLCAGKNRAAAEFTGQNGTPYNFKPVVQAKCGKKAKKGKKK